ncbi:MAG: QacE family quaternary ammonium compound efflux SMR transporter, partial [Rhizobiaceae bacterium]|nr:QacE family quaternary ammonium compound efflux SMR transporter [Rhizobiaceae bacterium]
VWTGIGAVGTVLVGILVFKEPATFLRILFLITLIGSIVGLKAVSAH